MSNTHEAITIRVSESHSKFRFRNFFNLQTSKQNSQLHSTPYTSTFAGESPTQGTYPVPGNGPGILGLFHHSKACEFQQDGDFDRPIICGSTPDLHKREINISRPRTAPAKEDKDKDQRARSKSRSRLSKTPNLRQAPVSAKLANRSSTFHSNATMLEIPTLPLLKMKHTRSGSVYVDIADVATVHDALPGIPRKDYGEDIADRNIADYGHKDSEITKERTTPAASLKSPKIDYGEDVADRNIAQFGADVSDLRRNSALSLLAPPREKIVFLQPAPDRERRNRRARSSRAARSVGFAPKKNQFGAGEMVQRDYDTFYEVDDADDDMRHSDDHYSNTIVPATPTTPIVTITRPGSYLPFNQYSDQFEDDEMDYQAPHHGVPTGNGLPPLSMRTMRHHRNASPPPDVESPKNPPVQPPKPDHLLRDTLRGHPPGPKHNDRPEYIDRLVSAEARQSLDSDRPKSISDERAGVRRLSPTTPTASREPSVIAATAATRAINHKYQGSGIPARATSIPASSMAAQVNYAQPNINTVPTIPVSQYLSSKPPRMRPNKPISPPESPDRERAGNGARVHRLQTTLRKPKIVEKDEPDQKFPPSPPQQEEIHIFPRTLRQSTAAGRAVSPTGRPQDEEGNRKESKGEIFKQGLKALLGIGRSESERMAEKEEETRGRDGINRDANGRRVGPEMMPTQSQIWGQPQMMQQPQMMPAIPPPIARGVDLRDIKSSEDTEYITSQRPAVTHERITPTQHTIATPQINREIHNTSIYTRVQPIQQTSVLPTKHFMRDPQNLSQLIEISQPAQRSVNDIMATHGSPRSSIASAQSPSVPHFTFQAQAMENGNAGNGGPVMESQQTMTQSDGAVLRETIWKHAPTFEREIYGESTVRNLGASMDMQSPTPIGMHSVAAQIPVESDEIPISGDTPTVVLTPMPVQTPSKKAKAKKGKGKTKVKDGKKDIDMNTYLHNIGDLEEVTDELIDQQLESAEEGLLFSESGFGDAGHLPGLNELSPMAGLVSSPGVEVDISISSSPRVTMYPTPSPILFSTGMGMGGDMGMLSPATAAGAPPNSFGGMQMAQTHAQTPSTGNANGSKNMAGIAGARALSHASTRADTEILPAMSPGVVAAMASMQLRSPGSGGSTPAGLRPHRLTTEEGKKIADLAKERESKLKTPTTQPAAPGTEKPKRPVKGKTVSFRGDVGDGSETYSMPFTMRSPKSSKSQHPTVGEPMMSGAIPASAMAGRGFASPLPSQKTPSGMQLPKPSFAKLASATNMTPTPRSAISASKSTEEKKTRASLDATAPEFTPNVSSIGVGIAGSPMVMEYINVPEGPPMMSQVMQAQDMMMPSPIVIPHQQIILDQEMPARMPQVPFALMMGGPNPPSTMSKGEKSEEQQGKQPEQATKMDSPKEQKYEQHSTKHSKKAAKKEKQHQNREIIAAQPAPSMPANAMPPNESAPQSVAHKQGDPHHAKVIPRPATVESDPSESNSPDKGYFSPPREENAHAGSAAAVLGLNSNAPPVSMASKSAPMPEESATNKPPAREAPIPDPKMKAPDNISAAKTHAPPAPPNTPKSKSQKKKEAKKAREAAMSPQNAADKLSEFLESEKVDWAEKSLEDAGLLDGSLQQFGTLDDPVNEPAINSTEWEDALVFDADAAPLSAITNTEGAIRIEPPTFIPGLSLIPNSPVVADYRGSGERINMDAGIDMSAEEDMGMGKNIGMTKQRKDSKMFPCAGTAMMDFDDGHKERTAGVVLMKLPSNEDELIPGPPSTVETLKHQAGVDGAVESYVPTRKQKNRNRAGSNAGTAKGPTIPAPKESIPIKHFVPPNAHLEELASDGTNAKKNASRPSAARHPKSWADIAADARKRAASGGQVPVGVSEG